MFGCFYDVKLSQLFWKLISFRNVLMITRCKLLVYKFLHMFEIVTVHTLLMIVC